MIISVYVCGLYLFHLPSLGYYGGLNRGNIMKEIMLLIIVFLPNGGIEKQNAGMYESFGACQVVQQNISKSKMYRGYTEVEFQARCEKGDLLPILITPKKAQSKPLCFTNIKLENSACRNGGYLIQ